MVFDEVLTVSQLTNQIKSVLEENFSQVSVLGEISNFKKHVSGHWYFCLKDSQAILSCCMWKGFNNFVFFTPQDGMKVIVNGKLTVFPPKGNYQVDVRSMKPAGAGELQTSFEILKRKLSAEGLFDEKHKKTIPRIPWKIGIVTATDGAALKDMISIARRRFPLAELIISPAKVQGTGAAADIVEHLRRLNNEPDIDVIIIARGGGSIEDLWAFNEETVARAVFRSRIPVITGIGHEIDFTIADFVADLRAPTPSAAMEIATPKISDFFAFINEFSYNSTKRINEICSGCRGTIFDILNSYGFRQPTDLIRKKSQQVDNDIYKLVRNFDRKILINANKLSLLIKSLEFHDFRKLLKKGFVLVKQENVFVKRLKDFNAVLPAVLKFFDGEVVVKKN